MSSKFPGSDKSKKAFTLIKNRCVRSYSSYNGKLTAFLYLPHRIGNATIPPPLHSAPQGSPFMHSTLLLYESSREPA
jgi:hypothetical protein